MAGRITIRGFLTNVDKYGSAHLMFLNDYEQDPKADPFTYNFLKTKARALPGTNPVFDETFKVKCGKSVGVVVLDKGDHLIMPIKSFQQKKVECVVSVKTYNFVKSGNRHHGWYLKLYQMKLLERWLLK